MSDFNRYMHAKDAVCRYRAERDAADTRLEYALMIERMRELISQHEPVASSGINRHELRRMLHYVETGRFPREEYD